MQTSEQFHIFEKKNEMLKLQHYWDYLFIIVSLKKQARKKTEFEISRSWQAINEEKTAMFLSYHGNIKVHFLCDI